jgi:uncharacterized membrane protein YkvA (DUF1232 family)
MESVAGGPSDSVIRKIVNRLKGKAGEYLRNKEKTKELLDAALTKAKEQAGSKGPLADVWGYLTALLRLLRAYYRREYTDIPWSSIVLVTVAIIYFVAPLDLIPDFIPVGGFVDDAAVIAFVVRQIKGDLDKFRTWEDERGFRDESVPA